MILEMAKDKMSMIAFTFSYFLFKKFINNIILVILNLFVNIL